MSRMVTVCAIVVEMVAPLVAVLPFYCTRVVGISTCVGLLVAMGASGNYGFFHVLTLSIIASMSGDDLLPWMPAQPTPHTSYPDASLYDVVVLPSSVALSTMYILATFSVIAADWRRGPNVKAPCFLNDSSLALLAPLGAAHNFSLFANMTPKRLEIVIFELHRYLGENGPAPCHRNEEWGVDAGTEELAWYELSFPCKPGCIDRRPCSLMDFHMPRVDWRFWFATLSIAGRGLSILGADPLEVAPKWVKVFLQKVRERESIMIQMWTSDRNQRLLLANKPLQTKLSLYTYRFSGEDDVTMESPNVEKGLWWTRQLIIDIES